jgi:protein phosphatase
VKKFATFCNETPNDELGTFLENANDALINTAKKELNVELIGTTFTGGIISANLIKGVHIGDSRVSVLRGNGIKQVTEEHNEAGRLIREGKLNPLNKNKYPRNNVIENIVGNKNLFEYQNFSFPLQPLDRIIFSTDGFHETLSKAELRDISVKYKSLESFFNQIVIEVESRVLRDNTSFILIGV